MVANLAIVGAVQAEDAPSKIWERHPGTVFYDDVSAVAADMAGNVIVAGDTFGSIGQLNAGQSDLFVIKYSAAGDVLWRRQKGSSLAEHAKGATIDPTGNIIVVGNTAGRLFGGRHGNGDAFILSYSADGTTRWRHQFGTKGPDSLDMVVTDIVGNIIVGGYLGPDYVLITYGTNGSEKWRRVVSTEGGWLRGMALAPDGTIVISGTTGELGPTGQDFFLAAYSSEGDRLWFKQSLVDGPDHGDGVAVASDGTIYLAGSEYGASTRSLWAFLAAYSPAGDQRWKRSVGGGPSDGDGVAIDKDGNVVVTLGTSFAASYTADGGFRWKMRLADLFPPLRPAFDPTGNLFLATRINLFFAGHVPTNVRGYDGYVAKFGD